MHDDLDLRVIERHHDADQRYREALRQRVAATLDNRDAVPTGEASPDLTMIDLVTQRPVHRQRHLRRWMASAAALVSAAAMIVALVALVVVAGRNDPVAPAVQPPPAPTVLVDETVPTTDPPDASPDTPELFVEIAPGAMVDLPDAPIANLRHTSGVWTGTEMIVWGGFGGDGQRSGVGAAFNLAVGTWRVLAPAPIAGRSEAAMVWTGTEMLVWGGFIGDDRSVEDGAAYNPVTDTWRLLPSAPATMGNRLTSMLWTGDEAIIVSVAAAAYNPRTDSWRRLADPPAYGYPASAEGDSVIMIDDASLMRYDLTADSWSVNNIGSQAALVVAPGSEGHIIALPSATGTPTQVIDSHGDPVAELPAFPGDPSLFGDKVSASGWWVGDEAVFWIWTGAFPHEPEQMWALNPTTQTWRQLDDTPMIEPAVVVAGDVLLAWGGSGPGGAPTDAVAGIAYRAGVAASD